MSDAVDTSAEACRGGVALLRAAMTPLLHSERLRLGSLIEALLAERAAAQAEVARLREALQRIRSETGRARGDQAHRDASRFAFAAAAKVLAKEAPRDPR